MVICFATLWITLLITITILRIDDNSYFKTFNGRAIILKLKEIKENLFHFEAVITKKLNIENSANESYSFPSIYSSQESTTHRKVKYVFGIPTVQRSVENYVFNTLKNLIENLSDSERNKTLLVLLNAETDSENANNITTTVHTSFGEHIENGLLEVIPPPVSYYPEFSNKTNLGDPIERVRWRTKQNLDYAFLMN
ncbi:alpha-1:3-mannosyl-glycoprotein 4-beta-N-acetylglucosaminyltransferase B-like protein, partial [Leptotrombidium deliense]